MAAFAPGQTVTRIKEISIGHIHHTYQVSLSTLDATARDTKSLGADILLQQFSTNVFPRYREVAANTDIIIRTLQSSPMYAKEFEISDPILDHRGSMFIFIDNSLWRCFRFIPNTRAFITAPNPEIVFNAATAFTKFQRATSQIAIERIQDPLVGYMDNPGRYQALITAVNSDPKYRSASVKVELSFIEDHKALFSIFSSLHQSSHYQPRVTHGDMKLNNALFDASTNAVKAIIDLDTCMIGDYLYDYGDFMRVGCSTAAEDEPDIALISVNREFTKAAVTAIMQQMSQVLSKEEKNIFPKAPAAMAMTIGCRFLTDYIQGDTYFGIAYPEHNLVRARNQLALCREFLKHEDVIRTCIE